MHRQNILALLTDGPRNNVSEDNFTAVDKLTLPSLRKAASRHHEEQGGYRCHAFVVSFQWPGGVSRRI